MEVTELQAGPQIFGGPKSWWRSGCSSGWNQFARQRNPRLFVMQWSLHWPSLAWPELEPEHEQLLHPSEITDAVGFQTNYATI